MHINDPDFEQAPKAIDLDEFLLAWSERDYEYAVIGLENLTEVE